MILVSTKHTLFLITAKKQINHGKILSQLKSTKEELQGHKMKTEVTTCQSAKKVKKDVVQNLNESLPSAGLDSRYDYNHKLKSSHFGNHIFEHNSV